MALSPDFYKQIAAAMQSYLRNVSLAEKPNSEVANYITKESLQLINDGKGPNELQLLRLAILIAGLNQYARNANDEKLIACITKLTTYLDQDLSDYNQLVKKDFIKNITDTVTYLQQVQLKQNKEFKLTHQKPWRVNQPVIFMTEKPTSLLQKPASRPSGETPTLNNMGFEMAINDDFTQEGIKIATSAKTRILELGSAYGRLTLEILETAANNKLRSKVIANDVHPEHLAILSQRTPEQSKDRLTRIPGKAPDDIDFPNNYFDVIFMNHFLHFFNPNMMETMLQKAHGWLKSGGSLVIVVGSPFAAPLKTFIPIFFERKNKGEKWPGFIANFKSYIEQNLPQLKDKVTEQFHTFDAEILSARLAEQGFQIIKSQSFTLPILPEIKLKEPVEYKDQEFTGALAIKL